MFCILLYIHTGWLLHTISGLYREIVRNKAALTDESRAPSELFNFKILYKLTAHLIPHLITDFSHNIIEYQFNVIHIIRER